MSATAIAERISLGNGGVTQTRLVKSEWVKFRSLRSTVYSLITAVVFIVGFGILISALRANDIKHLGTASLGNFDAAAVSLRGLFVAPLAVGVLGVLIVTGEYGTGMIRASLAAAPRRLPVLWAKLTVFVAVVFVIGAVSSFLAFTFGQAFLSSAHVGIGIGSPGAARAVFGGAIYLTLVGVLAVGLGFLLRNTGGALAALFGLLLVLPVLAQALPMSWYNHVFKFLPTPAGTQIMTTVHDPSSLSPWPGVGVFAVYAVAAVLAGAFVLRRRDA
ncbi:MAG: ABC transporter permease [Acidothermaceae bacterium]